MAEIEATPTNEEFLDIESEHYANPEEENLIDIDSMKEEDNFMQLEEQTTTDAFDEVDEDVEVDEDFRPRYGCWSGIKRWKYSSNSYSTFKKHQYSSTKWNDPSFTHDMTSISWKMFGYPTAQSFPRQISWVRPEDMGYY